MNNSSLQVSQERLRQYLGRNYADYVNLIKEFVQSHITLDEFDTQARRFFDRNTIVWHNDYIVALLNKLQKNDRNAQITRKPPPPKRAKRNEDSLVPFRDVFLEKLEPPRDVDKKKLEATLGITTTCADECRLPETWMVCGRLLACAYEHDLSDVAEGTVTAIILATRMLLKNILTCALVKVGKMSRPRRPSPLGPPLSALLPPEPFLVPRASVIAPSWMSDSSSPEQNAGTSASSHVDGPWEPRQPIRLTMMDMYRFMLDPTPATPHAEGKYLQQRPEICPSHRVLTWCLNTCAGRLWRQHHLEAAARLSVRSSTCEEEDDSEVEETDQE